MERDECREMELQIPIAVYEASGQEPPEQPPEEQDDAGGWLLL